METGQPFSGNSRYVVLETLQQTPGTKVLLAADTWQKQKVILKCVQPDAHPAWRMQFRMEVDVLQQLDSPWFPSLLEYQDDARGSWLCEEYLEGLSLSAWLKENPSRQERKNIFLQVVKCIQMVHQAGFLYLDLKPQNVLIVRSHACLIDFNACLPIGSLRPILTSKDALPPEGLAGQVMDERADQIGLGRLWLGMMGPSFIAWTALAADPERRFGSLEGLARAVKKTGRHRALAGAAALLCLFASLQSLMALSPSTLQTDLTVSGKDSKQDSRTGSEKALPNAAALCKTLAERPAGQPMETGEWLIASRAALGQSHIALAGWLYDHAPGENSLQVRFYRFLEGLLIGSDLPAAELDALIDQLPEQTGWSRQLCELFPALIQKRILLETAQMKVLAEKLADTETIDPEGLNSLMNYLLFLASQSGTFLSLPNTLEAALQEEVPDLISLYRRAALKNDPGALHEASRPDGPAKSTHAVSRP